MKAKSNNHTIIFVILSLYLHHEWRERACSVLASSDVNVNNPFHQGCLNTKQRLAVEATPGGKGEVHQLRVCNSDDDPDAVKLGYCRAAELPYMEVRVHPSFGDMGIGLSWLVQILLSELLGVPSTVEGGSKKVNFYQPNPDPFPGGVDVSQSLSRASQLRDCRLAKRDEINYEPCAHFHPDIWKPQEFQESYNWLTELVQNSSVTEIPLGYVGLETWYATSLTVKNDPSLASYLGFQGEENRQKLADTFLRPATWLEYCENVSNSSCEISDNTAKRPPQNESEYHRYFVPDLYTGHFHKTERNNCVKYPENCTGHFADVSCDFWGITLFETQSYYLQISLESNGPSPINHGYLYYDMMEIILAANSTKSNLIIYGNTGYISRINPILSLDSKLVEIAMPGPSGKCYDSRPKKENCCSENFTERIGKPYGVCPAEYEVLKVMSHSVYEMSSNSSIPAAIQSPAYVALSSFRMSWAQREELFSYLQNHGTPREAICDWAFQNVDFLKSFLPSSYPRVAIQQSNGALCFAVIAVGALTVLLVLYTSYMVHSHRNLEAIKCAQISFLWIILSGSLLIAIGAVVVASPVSTGTCVAAIWLVNIGYSLELVPMIVKAAAINKIVSAARQYRRIVLPRKYLLGAVFGITVIMAVYLLLWSILDHPKPTKEFQLTEMVTESNNRVVKVDLYCSSQSDVWMFSVVGWNALLLLSASVLAFQSRNIQEKLNESQVLAFLIYSHFFFVLMRLVLLTLSVTQVDLSNQLLQQIQSLIFSFDTIGTLLVYFAPKFINLQGRSSSSTTIRSSATSSLRNSATTIPTLARFTAFRIPFAEKVSLITFCADDLACNQISNYFEKVVDVPVEPTSSSLPLSEIEAFKIPTESHSILIQSSKNRRVREEDESDKGGNRHQ